MRERRIRRWQVRWLVQHGWDEPEYLIDPEPNERCKRGRLHNGKEARTIYLEYPTHLLIITIMWVE